MSADPISRDQLEALFPGDGEMARLIRDKDWTQTPLGDPRTWPDGLLHSLSILLGSRYPMEIWWGPEYLRFYNDAYRPLLGPDRHPHFLGRPGRECWAEVWDEIGPMLDGVMQTGVPTYSENSRLLLTRKGFVEETYVTWSYGPIRSRQGRIEGIFCACDETTGRVLDRRRLATLSDLGLTATDTASVPGDALAVLARNPHDTPFALVYQGDPDGTATLLGQTGSIPSHLSPAKIIVTANDAPWPLGRAATEEEPVIVEHSPGQKVAIFSLLIDDRGTRAFVILGTSPQLELDHGYLDFLRLVARHFAATLEARNTRQRIVREQSRLRSAFMQSPAFMCILRGPDHVFDFINDQYAALVGRDDILGKAVAVALPEVVSQGFIRILDDVWSTGVPYIGNDTTVFLQKMPDAPLEKVVIDFVYQPLQEADGSISGILAHGIDITEEKRGQRERERLLLSEKAARAEAERASMMKEEFLATLSHELRTPLTAILGWSQILRLGSSLTDDLNNGLEIIERNARAQTQIIEDLLDMSRIISGKVRLDVQRLDLPDVVREAIRTVQAAADAKGIFVQSMLDPQAGPITGDPGRLQQVFWNLLNNAIKFTPKDGHVQVHLARVNSHIEVSVQDTGQGIPPDFLPHVFDRFQQADASSTRRQGGLGLGLALVKQLVELHGGRVEARSGGENQGSTFTVTLPLTVVHADKEVPAELRHPNTSYLAPDHAPLSLSGLRILAIDDEPDARALVQRVLEHSNARVTTAASAREGLAEVEAGHFDVIVCDIGMPGADGYHFIGQLREMSGHKGTIPALALTAYARSSDRTKALRTGFQMHISKPVEPSELVTVVASLGGKPRKLE